MNLNQITLPAPDVAAARDFYVALGFTLIVDSPPHYARLQAPEGDATLSVHQAAAPAHDATWPGVYLECDNLDAVCARLRAAGLTFESEPQDQSWLWREAWLRDPAGNRICLYWAGENRVHPPWRVATSS